MNDDTKPNLADFENMGDAKTSPTPPPAQPVAASSATPASQNAAPATHARTRGKQVNPKRLAIGCLGFTGILFFILISAMVVGLASGEATIQSFGFDPISFKNWTIGLVSLAFGTIAIAFVLAIVFQVTRLLFAERAEQAMRRRAVRLIAVFSVFAILTLTGWGVVYSMLNQFLTNTDDFIVEILTEPRNTLGLTSPVTLAVSGELVTRKFARQYDIVSFQWDKDSDGTIDATGERTQLYFQDGGQNNGVYTVTLRATLQPRGNHNAPVEIKEYQKRVSIAHQEMYGEIIADRESGTVPLTVRFDGSQIRDPHGARILNYRWDLTGNGLADLDGPQFGRAEWTFDTVGDHTVELTVTSSDFDADGVTHETKTFSKTISVYQPADMVEADAVIGATPDTGTAPLRVNFDASRSGRATSAEIDRFEWTINDGAEKFFGMRNSYTFTQPGQYLVTLRVVYKNGVERNDTVTITVVGAEFAPEAVIQTTPGVDARTRRVAGPAPFSVAFDGSGSRDKDNNIVRYQWDTSGDGFFDTEGSQITHVFRETGEYRVRLRVTDADNLESEATVLVLVDDALPVVRPGASVRAGMAPLLVSFDASGSRMTGREIVGYAWDFGDGTSGGQLSGQAQVDHLFTTPGVYTVRLTLHASDGSTATGQEIITVTDAPLSAAASLSRTSGTAPLAVSFDAADSQGQIARYLWQFGDGATSDAKRTIHTFQKAGTYTVVLQIFDAAGNVATTSQTVTVH